MINFGLLIVELGLIYLSRGHLTKQLFRLVNSHGGGHRAFTIIWSIIFLPGTIIHEMSHFFAAAFTGTHIGKVEIFPTFRLPLRQLADRNDEQAIHLGSVQTQELGLFRGFIVGTAPLLVGVGLLIWLSANLKTDIFNASLDPSTEFIPLLAGLGMTERLIPLLRIYVFFTVANSLFPSWVDFKHALPLVAVGVILGVALSAIGVQPIISPDSFIFEIISRLQAALAWSVGINVAATGLIWGINKLLYGVASSGLR